jgi:hypothetical protein
MQIGDIIMRERKGYVLTGSQWFFYYFIRISGVLVVQFSPGVEGSTRAERDYE